MDTQVHAGEGHQHRDDDADDAHPSAAGELGNAAEGAHGVLGMAAGERIAGGLGAGALYNGEVAVQHPRARDTEEQLQELVQHRSGKAHRQQIVAVALADAPEDEQRRHHKDGLLPQVSDGRHHRVQPRRADGFQGVQHLHNGSPPLFSFSMSSIPCFQRGVYPRWNCRRYSATERVISREKSELYFRSQKAAHHSSKGLAPQLWASMSRSSAPSMER